MFFLSNIEGEADLINLSYETKIPFNYIYKYCQSFVEKGMIEMKQSTIGGKNPSITSTSLTRSGLLNLEK